MLYKDKKTILSDLDIPECLEVWIFSIKVSYDEKDRSITMVEKLYKEDGSFHFSNKRERIIHNEQYGKSFLLKPSYIKTSEYHSISVPLFMYPTTDVVIETRRKLIAKLIEIIELKQTDENYKDKQLLKRLKLFRE